MCNSRTHLSEASTVALSSSLRRRRLSATTSTSKKCQYNSLSSLPPSFIPHFDELREKVHKKSSSNANMKMSINTNKQPMRNSKDSSKVFDLNSNLNSNTFSSSCCDLHSNEKPFSLQGPVEPSIGVGVEDVVAIIRNGVKQYHCLRKALLLYLLGVYFNLIVSTGERDGDLDTDTTTSTAHTTTSLIISKTWNFFFNFLRYYPTLVGWLFLAIKMKRIIFAEEGIMNIYQYYHNPSKYQRGWSVNSTDTCDTYSSYMSTIAEETDLEVELKDEHILMDTKSLDAQEHTYTSNRRSVSSSPTTRRQNRQMSSSWGYFADTGSSSMVNGCGKKTGSSSSMTIESQYPNEECGQQQDEDWGFFADIDNVEPETQEKRPTTTSTCTHRARSPLSMPTENYHALTKYIGEGFRIFAR